jgi:hypothetical protein
MPLFVAHTYRQERREDWRKGQTSVVGLKARFDRFTLDMHQRAQTETHVHLNENGGAPLEKTAIHKVFYQAELDCEGTDIRAVTAIFLTPEKAVYAEQVASKEDHEPDDDLPINSEPPRAMTEDDRSWIDIHDFDDISTRYEREDARFSVLPIATCPRFTYYRQPTAKEEAGEEETDEAKASSDRPQPISTSKFGDEDTHHCCIGEAAGARCLHADGAARY